MGELSSAERKYLRGLAHHLKPLVLIGQAGVTDALIASINEALEEHELIKIKFNSFKEEKKDLLPDIERRTRSEMAGLIGHIAILYRQQHDKDKRKIPFPPPKK